MDHYDAIVRAFITCSWLMCLAFCVLAETGPGAAAAASKPSLLVSLERQTIRESDIVLIEVLVWNADSEGLTDAVLQITSPDFLSWYEVEEPERKTFHKLDQNKLKIGNIAGNSMVRKTICVQSEPVIRVGSFNLLFTVEFKREMKNEFISAERAIQANLFGSDAIAGVPVVLAGFIVPGLFFWLTLSTLRVPWSVGLALGEKLIYSVIVSAVFVIASAWITRITRIDIDAAKGIGILKLFYLAVGGGLLGTAVSLPYLLFQGYRKLERRQEAKRQLQFNDLPETIFRKLLLKNSNAQARQFRITLTNQNADVYVGSLFDQTPNTPSLTGFTSVVGWCSIHNEIDPQAPLASRFKRLLNRIRHIRSRTPAQVWQEMQQLSANNELAELYDLAKLERFRMGWEGVVHSEEGALVHTGINARQWRNDEVSGAPVGEETDNRPVRLV